MKPRPKRSVHIIVREQIREKGGARYDQVGKTRSMTVYGTSRDEMFALIDDEIERREKRRRDKNDTV